MCLLRHGRIRCWGKGRSWQPPAPSFPHITSPPFLTPSPRRLPRPGPRRCGRPRARRGVAGVRHADHLFRHGACRCACARWPLCVRRLHGRPRARQGALLGRRQQHGTDGEGRHGRPLADQHGAVHCLFRCAAGGLALRRVRLCLCRLCQRPHALLGQRCEWRDSEWRRCARRRQRGRDVDARLSRILGHGLRRRRQVLGWGRERVRPLLQRPRPLLGRGRNRRQRRAYRRAGRAVGRLSRFPRHGTRCRHWEQRRDGMRRLYARRPALLGKQWRRCRRAKLQRRHLFRSPKPALHRVPERR